MLASTGKSYAWASFALSLLGIATIGIATLPVDPVLADQPSDGLQLPTFDYSPPQQSNAPAKKKIRQALENPSQAEDTGDLVLDGVIDVIRSQGSLVEQRLAEFPEFSRLSQQPEEGQSANVSDGFPVAQPQLEQPQLEQPQLEQPQLEQPQLEQPALPSESEYLLAEQLLMTARLLNKDPDQGARRQLIQLLRDEAARCLNSTPEPVHPATLMP